MLQAKGQAVWQQFSERYPQQAEALQVFAPDIIVGFSLSDFIADSCLKDAELLSWLFIDKQLSCAQPDYANYWSQIHEIQDEANLAQHLRRFRRRWMVQLAWRDLTHQQSIAQSLTDVSALADTLINGAYHWLYADMCSKHGMPMGSLGPQPMLIWGMGKLGGQELNFSSDIDLIFAYPEPGETDARRGLEHQIWFQRLAQKLIAALHQITADGQVFRVDMRLRPFGDSGPIVSHFAALEDYYQQQGRDWERYAMLKARIINPDGRYSEQLEQIRRPFVFRRYIDFSAIESLRRMKSMISQEVRRRQLTNNIKLGAGGIREIEFIVQSLQLIRAGRQASLQTRNLLQTLQVMEQEQVLEASDCQALRDCYLYLRRVEHYLQQFNDAQTQTLPDDGLNQQRLCRVCEVADFSALLAQVQGVMAEVSHHFELLIGEEAEGASSCDAEFNDAWLLELSDNEAQALLADKLSQTQIADLWPAWQHFRDYMLHHPIGQRGKETLDKLMPLILQEVVRSDDASSLPRLYTVIKAISRRTAYLELLFENQGALRQLIRLCAASPWITEQIARFPVLLDELLNPQMLYQPTPLQSYASEIRQYFLRIDPDDLELQMETLRQYKLAEQLRIAAADVTGALPVMKVSDHLTYLAEAIIDQAVHLAWQQMTARYGYPAGASDDNLQFAVVGYGKLGGLELGYGSDLDLVFIHGCDGNELTSGEKSIESRQFYLRLAQRIMHIFATKTASGELYEVDLRLRPAGNSGLLVCHMDGFAQYQQQEAWTWEHQALTRSRMIFGSDTLYQQFAKIRHAVLAKPRDIDTLRQEVREMRDKMRSHLSQGDESKFDLKQDRGGIADIEFIVQFLVLAHSHGFPELTRWPDNVRIIEQALQHDLLTSAQASTLNQAYLAYRNRGHHLTLQGAPLLVEDQELMQLRGEVSEIWQQLMN
ncbi:bifunctional [glutamate--ammonia ligase]-adenylyl-L-tyrosine phosphorylase/[glutamate--ammonia-ligase] adenylyltransferase [Bowmanella sp. JS7-9]|uniref:Bifunctional glutamine synthetase adenylyltransferase/adenylyl-removing enzyme n=3 Tax=Pseudobowmanella zhangzhouensis TaxID=1537679 RepID=A0ABW1XFC8_9ALTE|nr:bifunctional [glutamate--ammonia ligase]-adenylyl-L-tyrosine phosphorylase/[glutamate--ammonia-ligase] adenylyltransferase [Bowmanella sp. JS7-9]TBX21268.1 hypothetical protein TK45_11905 [Bowmanella sp. JS7-9]